MHLTSWNWRFAAEYTAIFSWDWCQKEQTHKIEWCILYSHKDILRFVVASVVEAKLGVLFHNCHDGILFLQTLADLGYPQPKTPVCCENAMVVGITNNMVIWQHSESMEMRFFGIGDRIAQNMYNVSWHPGQENLADCQSKHHIGNHHKATCTKQTPQSIYHRQLHLALWKGVLEP